MVNRKTKKMLVAYDSKKPDARGANFVVPLNIEGGKKLISIKSGKSVNCGLVVFVGKDVTANDIIEKLKPFNANEIKDAPSQIDSYIESINEFKIGDIIKINENGELTIMPKPDIVKKSKLP